MWAALYINISDSIYSPVSCGVIWASQPEKFGIFLFSYVEWLFSNILQLDESMVFFFVLQKELISLLFLFCTSFQSKDIEICSSTEQVFYIWQTSISLEIVLA